MPLTRLGGAGRPVPGVCRGFVRAGRPAPARRVHRGVADQGDTDPGPPPDGIPVQHAADRDHDPAAATGPSGLVPFGWARAPRGRDARAGLYELLPRKALRHPGAAGGFTIQCGTGSGMLAPGGTGRDLAAGNGGRAMTLIRGSRYPAPAGNGGGRVPRRFVLPRCRLARSAAPRSPAGSLGRRQAAAASSASCPWLNQSLPISQRVHMLLAQMTRDKINMVTGGGHQRAVRVLHPGHPEPVRAGHGPGGRAARGGRRAHRGDRTAAAQSPEPPPVTPPGPVKTARSSALRNAARGRWSTSAPRSTSTGTRAGAASSSRSPRIRT